MKISKDRLNGGGFYPSSFIIDQLYYYYRLDYCQCVNFEQVQKITAKLIHDRQKFYVIQDKNFFTIRKIK